MIKGIRITVVLVIAVGIALFFMQTRPVPKREQVKHQSPLVEVMEVKSISPPMIVSAYGTVRSGENVNITAEVGGTVVEVAPNFEEGAFFARGSFLLRIDPRDYELVVKRLGSDIERLNAEMVKLTQERKNYEASLAIIRKDVEIAEDEYERNRLLCQRKVISQNQLDQTRQKLLGSRNVVQQIRNNLALIKPRSHLLRAQRQAVGAQLDKALLDLERTKVLAPFDCRIAEKKVERGQFITRGSLLAHIYNTGIMEVEIRIPLHEAAWLDIGTVADELNDRPVKTKAGIIYESRDKDFAIPGFVSRIIAQIEERTRTLPLVVQIEGNQSNLPVPVMPGMFVRVELVGKRIDNLFLLPQSAVHNQDTVYIVNESHVRRRDVRIIRRLDNTVYVAGALNSGDKVILRLPGVISEEQEVRVRQIDAQDDSP